MFKKISILWLAAILVAGLASPALAGGRAFFKKGFEEADRGNHDQAIEYFTKAIASGTLSRDNRAVAYFNRGASYYEKGMYDQAIKDYNTALEYNPSYPGIYAHRADAWFQMGSYKESVADYDLAIQEESGNPVLYYNRAHAYYKMGSEDKAIADFKKACDMGDEEACKLYEQLTAPPQEQPAAK